MNNKVVTYDNWNPRRRREKGTEAIMTENFLQINARYQTTEPGSSENTKPKQDKCQKKMVRHLFTLYHYSIVWSINTLENQWQRKILKEAKGETSYLQRSKEKNFIEPILRNYVRR